MNTCCLNIPGFPSFSVLFKPWLWHVSPGGIYNEGSILLGCPAPWSREPSATGISAGGAGGISGWLSSRAGIQPVLRSPAGNRQPSCLAQVPVPIVLHRPWAELPCGTTWSHRGITAGLLTADRALPPRKMGILLKVYRFSQASSNNSHGKTLYTWGWSLNFLSLLFPCCTD